MGRVWSRQETTWELGNWNRAKIKVLQQKHVANALKGWRIRRLLHLHRGSSLLKILGVSIFDFERVGVTTVLCDWADFFVGFALFFFFICIINVFVDIQVWSMIHFWFSKYACSEIQQSTYLRRVYIMMLAMVSRMEEKRKKGENYIKLKNKDNHGVELDPSFALFSFYMKVQ